jgi:hypothetical protein
LSDREGALVLTVGVPEFIADERHTYLLQYKSNPLATDTVDLTIDPIEFCISNIGVITVEMGAWMPG